MKRALVLLLMMGLLLCHARAQESYPDGIYRGFYYDGGIEQLAVQFELKDSMFRSIVYRSVRYKDGDYMSRDASDAQKATLDQYYQLAQHLVGKGIEAIDDLYSPYDFVGDADAVTSATIQSSKLISALWDGLNRHPFKLVDTTKLQTAEDYPDGQYRGQYVERDGGQVGIDFSVMNNRITGAQYTLLQYEGVDYLSDVPGTEGIRGQFEALLLYLLDKPVSAVNDLYLPGNIADDIDGFSGATLRAPKVISAIWDGLGRHAYRID